jgi:hypothetical protein
MHSAVEDFDAFRGEMWLGVQDGAFLFEFPGGSSVHTPDGVERRGPWAPEECSRCLLTWFERRWVDAHVLAEHLARWGPDGAALLPDPDDDSSRILDRARARAILADPQAWTSDRPEGLLVLCPTGHAPSGDLRQLWLQAIAPAN